MGDLDRLAGVLVNKSIEDPDSQQPRFATDRTPKPTALDSGGLETQVHQEILPNLPRFPTFGTERQCHK